MMWFGWNDGWWGIVWMVVWMLVMVGVVWAIIAAVLRSSNNDGTRRRDPKDVLAERFAKGEIDADEYRERLHVLDEAAGSGSRR
jgi:putative membrane protein